MKKNSIIKIMFAASLLSIVFAGTAFAADVQKADFTLETKTALDFGQLAKFNLPVIADYGSEGCGPCRKMWPALKKTNEKYRGRAFIKFAEVWKNPKTAGDMPLQVIPTQFFFTAEGKPFVPSDKLAKKLKFIQYSDKSGKHALTAHQGGLSETDFDAILQELGVR